MDAQKKKEKIEQLKKGLNIAKKIAIKTGKIGAKIGKKILKKGAKITIVTARASYKGTKKAYKKYRSLNKDARRNLHHGVLVATGVLGLAGTMYMSRYTPEKSSEPQEQKNDARADSIRAALTQTYKITDEESFKQLYDAALPLIQTSMIPIEIYKESGYDDRGGKNFNSIGIGNFYYPEDGNPENPVWISTTKYLNKHPETKVDFEKALVLIDAWFRIRDRDKRTAADVNKVSNTVYKCMFRKLQGAEMTPHQFAAAATCFYNSEGMGGQFCDYIQQNYKNPQKCALFLINLKPKTKRKKPTELELQIRDGILKRHTAEACLYMYPEYAEAVYSLKMKDAVNSKGRPYTITSINQTTPEQCKIVQADMEKGSTRQLNIHKNRIMKYMCKGGYTIADMIQKDIKNADIRSRLLCYSDLQPGTISFEEVQADNLYAQALKAYNEGDYAKAVAGFQQLRANGYDGADLRCDIALTHYHLGEYQECIDECRAVLETGEEYLYPRATFNAGKAYEAMQNYERAKINYERSKFMAEKNQLNDTLKKVYQNAINRVDSIIRSKQPKDILPPKNPKPNNAPQATPKTTPKVKKSAKTPSTKPKTNKNKITPQKAKQISKARGR